MTADASYPRGVYRKLGGATLVVAATGTIEVEDGGLIQVDSGGSIDIQSGSSFKLDTPLEMQDGGYVKNYYAAKSKLNKTQLVAGQYCTLTASSTAPAVALPAPVAGAWVCAKCIEASSTLGGTIVLTSTVDFAGTVKNKLKFDQDGEVALLMGTTAAWALVYSTATSTS